MPDHFVPRSLQARMLALILGLVLLVWASAAWMTWRDAEHELDELLDGHLAQAASMLIEHQRQLDVAQESQDLSEGEVHGREMDAVPRHKYAFKVAFQVFHEGKIVFRSAQVADAPLTHRQQGFETAVLPDGYQWRLFVTRGHEQDVRVIVAERTDLRRDILWAVLRSVLKPLLVALPLLMLAVWWAIQRGLQPLRALVHSVGRRQPQALEPIGLGQVPTEVQALVEALNELFERIGNMVDGERRFTADAAHELRTPIAAIRAHVQVAQLVQGDQRAQALTATLQGCDRATRLVEQLLQLARLENSANAASTQINLGAVARRVCASMAPAALERGQSLSLDAPDQAGICADELLTEVLLRNLLDNAARYSPEAATIQAGVRQTEDGVELCVQDSGPGLAEADMQRLGQRFFRVLGNDQPGSGLGWSIVRRIARVQGALIEVTRSSQLGGLEVRVLWPQAKLGG